MLNQSRTRIRRLAAGFAVSAAVALMAAPALAQDTWATLTTSDERALAQLLGRVEADAGSVGGTPLKSSLDRLRTSLEAREAERAEKIKETETELDEHLGTAADLRREGQLTKSAVAVSDALDSVLALQQLHEDEDRFNQTETVRGVIRLGEREAQAAEERGEWLLSYELYVRLNALLDIEEPYEKQMKRIGRRLAMIRLYAPEKYWELRDARRQLDDLDPLPPYNPTGDSYDEKIGGVRATAVVRGIEQAATRHLDRDRTNRGELVEAGLIAIETFATTPELYETFPTLADEQKREDFLRVVRRQREIVSDAGAMVDLRDSFNVLNRVLTQNRFSVGIPEEAIIHEYGNGAMSTLDDYSAIIWPDGIERLQRTTEGSFSGVGIQIEEAEDTLDIRVVSPLEGTPAQRAGIRTGDIIRAVDGQSTVGFTLDQAVDVITGETGTEVVLTIERPDLDDADAKPETLKVPLRRASIPVATVKGWRRTGPGDMEWNWFVDEDAGIGYVRLTQFTSSTTRDFDKAIAEMKRQGLNGLILDLRFNPGGILDQAVDIVNRFIPAGRPVVRTVAVDDRILETKISRSIPARKRIEGIPVAVLVNNGSASASEIVSGSLQAHAREGAADVVIVGQRSFGKGSVQSVFGLDNSPPVGMKLTESFYRPFGDREIHRMPGATEWGVEPDIEVEMLLDKVSESLRLRRDADIWPTDELGRLIENIERPDPDRLVTEGLDLQLGAALVALQRAAAEEGTKVSSIVP